MNAETGGSFETDLDDEVTGTHHGLMQVSDELLTDSNINIDSDLIYNTNINTMVGVKYLSHLQKLFNGDMEKVIAAYNAGEGTVMKAVDKYGEDNWKKGLKEETIKYLPKVIDLWEKMM